MMIVSYRCRMAGGTGDTSLQKASNTKNTPEASRRALAHVLAHAAGKSGGRRAHGATGWSSQVLSVSSSWVVLFAYESKLQCRC